jgi:hypothetical protein
MSCAYRSTVPSPGDDVVVLLRKWLQAVGASFGCPDEREYNLVWKLVEHYGGTPRPGDTLPELWQKVLRALGDNTCHCGDWEWNTLKRILDILSPGSFNPGDSIYQLLRKILDAVNSGVTPVVCATMNDWGGLAGPIVCFEDWGALAGPVTSSDDWGSV